MARNHGRVSSSIWQDTEFTSLAVRPQRLYLFLLSQPNLSHLGVLPLTERRWARAVPGYTDRMVSEDLHVLHDARFIVLDEDTEELLVRTLLRNDGVYKQPNTLLAAIASVPTIASVQIKRCLAEEVAKVSLDDLADDGKRGTARGHLDRLLEALFTPDEDPSPSHQRTPREGFGEPQGEPPTHTRARPLAPTPTPNPHQNSLARLTPSEFDAWWSAYPRKVGKEAARRAYAKARKKVSVDVLLAGVHRLRTDPNLPAAEFIPHASKWLNDGRWDDEPYAPRNAVLNKAEDRDRRNLALVQHFATFEQGEIGA